MKLPQQRKPFARFDNQPRQRLGNLPPAARANRIRRQDAAVKKYQTWVCASGPCEASSKANPDPDTRPADIDALIVGKDPAESVLEIDNQTLGDVPCDPAAERQHGPGEVARQIGAEHHAVLRETPRDIGSA